MFNKFLEVTAKFGATTGYLFVKAASSALSVADVVVARETEEDNVVTKIIAGCNIDDPTLNIMGIPLAYNQPNLVCSDVLRFLSVDMDWDVAAVLTEFGMLSDYMPNYVEDDVVGEEMSDEPEIC